MIFSIAKKDFLLNLVSSRFVIGFLLCLFLIPFTLIVTIDDYSEQLRIYALDRDKAEKEFKEVRVYSNLRPEIVKPPEPLSIFSGGIGSNVGNRVKIWLGEKPLMSTGKSAIRDNPLLNSFFSIDFISILAIVLSLLAIIFTYDSCTGEKEHGTLKLKLSNSISRSKILLGKVIGVYLTILPVIIFCYLLAFLFVLNFYNSALSVNNWIQICLLFFASILFLSAFIFIGLFISTRMHSSMTSIIACLFVWVFFVFIIPNMSVYIAENFITIQSQDDLQYVLNDLDKEFQGKYNENRKKLGEPGEFSWFYNHGRDGYEEIYGASHKFMEFHRQLHALGEPIRIEYADKKWAFQKNYLEQLDRQRFFAEMMSMLSPSELFRSICSAICQTDVESHHRFMYRMRIYREDFIGYLKSKNLFSSFSYFTPQPPEKFITIDEIVRIGTAGKFKNSQEFFKWASTDPNPLGAFIVDIPGTKPGDYDMLDLFDMPVFQLQPGSIFADLRNTLIKISALLIISVVLFWLSFVSFIKYDVR